MAIPGHKTIQRKLLYLFSCTCSDRSCQFIDYLANKYQRILYPDSQHLHLVLKLNQQGIFKEKFPDVINFLFSIDDSAHNEIWRDDHLHSIGACLFTDCNDDIKNSDYKLCRSEKTKSVLCYFRFLFTHNDT